MTAAGSEFEFLAEGAEERIHVTPGEYKVSGDVNVKLTTLLGSF